MVLFTMENVPESLRGECTRYLLEIKAGVFLGSITTTVRELLWKRICESAESGSAVMAYAAQTEQGFLMEMHGSPRRQVIDIEGLQLIKIKG